MSVPTLSTSRRAWYPSGPKIDSHGNQMSVSLESQPPAPPEPQNPDPDNWKIVQEMEIGPHLVVKVNYPGCTNYEGDKILVYQWTRLIDLVNQRTIDPHFNPSSPEQRFPFTRFEPTTFGWDMAVSCARELVLRNQKSDDP